eukprot:CAMPEP_0182476390 /NCGR_PEP_ID=MMETSP1319-20130603/29006_1 /TAXON_ID=172717 /ORGANISM="Bolidomonas pacifica, Strain RCC208" /LENGTH=62 /DNA_ID=CAMNT_0024677473 /DNA_START=24 /DNA_END=209 /DNA_ORIENTATION=+
MRYILPCQLTTSYSCTTPGWSRSLRIDTSFLNSCASAGVMCDVDTVLHAYWRASDVSRRSRE